MIFNRKRSLILLVAIGAVVCLTGCCSHVWTEATCTSPETCTECGATRGDVAHHWVEATCTSPKTCTECGTTDGDVVHTWLSATCTTPQTCQLCGATQGGLADTHTWLDATCTSPKMCSECGLTDGGVAHSFEVIQCDEPTVCSGCGQAGEIIGHIWADATCEAPKTCNSCGETEGAAIGHSTRRGTCSKCGEYVNNVAYKDGFAVVTYSDTTWMQERDDFTDVYVIGEITQISKVNDITIVDSEGKRWTVDLGTACDLSSYIGTECEVYGFSSGGISSQHKTPLINMSHDDNRIVFADGKELYPEDFDSTQQFSSKYTGSETSGEGGKVWVPTDGGTKYHSKASCSGMYNPKQTTKAEAENAGFSKCGKCW